MYKKIKKNNNGHRRSNEMKKNNETTPATMSSWEQCKYQFRKMNFYIKHHAWLYATIIACIKFFGPIFNCIGWMVIITLTLDLIIKGALMGYIIMYFLIGLGAGILAMTWYEKYMYIKKLNTREEQQWQDADKFAQELTDAHFENREHTETEKEAYKQMLLKNVSRPYFH